VNLTVLFFPREGSVISLQADDSLPQYNQTEKSVVFENVKVPGSKEIGINVTACSRVSGLTVFINGKYADVVKKKSVDKNGCTIKSFKTMLDMNPSVMGNVTVILKDMKNPNSATHAAFSIALFILLLLLWL